MAVMGIDEAGRGPIVGSMFMACVVIKEGEEKILKRWGVKDSKQVPPKKREELFQKIVSRFQHKIIGVSPEQIDRALTRALGSNLNWLEADTQAILVSSFPVSRVIVDCPSPNTVAFARYLKKKIEKSGKKDVEVVAEHKADVNHMVVAAASILAKVKRDEDVARLRNEIGIDFGSGYLTDQKTVQFLETHWKTHSEIFRRQWAPYKELMKKSEQATLGGFGSKNLAANSSQPAVSSSHSLSRSRPSPSPQDL